MVDNISLKVPRQRDMDLTEQLEHLWRRDINTYSGHIRNIGFYQNLDGITIRGSLAKYLNGENMTPLTREQVKSAIKKLERVSNSAQVSSPKKYPPNISNYLGIRQYLPDRNTQK